MQLVEALLRADKSEHSIFDVNAMADLDIIDQVLMRARDAEIGANDRLPLDDQLIADVDRHSTGAVDIRHLPEPDLRPAQIAQDRDWMTEPRRRLTDVPQDQQVLLAGAMRKIQPADIRARFKQAIQRVRVLTR